MIAHLDTAPPEHLPGAHQTMELALRLAHAENALNSLTSGQVDAIVDPDGRAYLLRPAQEQLRQSERGLQDIIESAADVIMVVNRGGMIVSESGAAARVLGSDFKAMVGSSVFKLVHEEDLAIVHSAFFNVAEGLTKTATAQFRYLIEGGDSRPIEATVGKLKGSSGRVVFVLRGVNAPRPTRNEHLARERFLAMLAHELRTPLMPVLLGLDELEQDGRFGDAGPTFTMIRRNVALQARLLEELLDFAIIGQNKLNLRLEAVDAHEAVHFVLEICRALMVAAQITVELDLQASQAFVVADSARLQQVMWNLVKNAIKFSSPGSSISISSSNDSAGKLTLEFVDHGIGIEPDLLPLVFDAYQQGDHTLQKLYGGLGLGLFIAKGLTEAQQGTLTVASAGRNQGSLFRLSLNTTTSDHLRADSDAVALF